MVSLNHHLLQKGLCIRVRRVVDDELCLAVVTSITGDGVNPIGGVTIQPTLIRNISLCFPPKPASTVQIGIRFFSLISSCVLLHPQHVITALHVHIFGSVTDEGAIALADGTLPQWVLLAINSTPKMALSSPSH